MSGRGLLIPVPGTLARSAALVAAGAATLFAARAFEPRGSQAAEPHAAIEPASGPVFTAPAVAAPAFLGTLEGPSFQVEVFIERAGPRYTVKDRQGALLAQRLTSDELRRRFPVASDTSLDPATIATRGLADVKEPLEDLDSPDLAAEGPGDLDQDAPPESDADPLPPS